MRDGAAVAELAVGVAAQASAVPFDFSAST